MTVTIPKAAWIEGRAPEDTHIPPRRVVFRGRDGIRAAGSRITSSFLSFIDYSFETFVRLRGLVLADFRRHVLNLLADQAVGGELVEGLLTFEDF